MKHQSIIYVVAFASLLLGSGCATGTGGFNSAKKIDQLMPGMTMQQVTAILGRPASTQFIDGHIIWKYSLQRPFVGWIPHYLAFDSSTRKLAGWREDMNEYYQSQSLWLQTLPRQHNVNVQGNIYHH